MQHRLRSETFFQLKIQRLYKSVVKKKTKQKKPTFIIYNPKSLSFRA